VKPNCSQGKRRLRHRPNVFRPGAGERIDAGMVTLPRISIFTQMIEEPPCDFMKLFEELRRQASACASLPKGAVSNKALHEFLSALENACRAAHCGSLKEIERAFREALSISSALFDKSAARH
jgi:hypothetical protein